MHRESNRKHSPHGHTEAEENAIRAAEAQRAGTDFTDPDRESKSEPSSGLIVFKNLDLTQVHMFGLFLSPKGLVLWG